jgi:nucleoside-diphosphate-sugar epimerase
VRGEAYNCYLGAGTTLPLIYMPDAIRATVELMEAPAEQIRIRSAYNVAGISFNPRDLAQAIKQHVPHFEIQYRPDHRQSIAESWPHSLDDSFARADWGWHARIGLEQLVTDMLAHIKNPSQQISRAA